MPISPDLRKPDAECVNISAALAAWYSVSARDLPWRVGPVARAAGVRPDPYHVYLSEIMLQQTTVATVSTRFAAFLRQWPNVEALAAAPVEAVMAAWAGLGYYARARNLHAGAVAVVRLHGGRFPAALAELEALPGIGPYTAAAIAAIAFDQPATVIDANVTRVVARLFAIKDPPPQARSAIAEGARRLTPAVDPGNHAQAMMDLGATVCRPRQPACDRCPVQAHCSAARDGLASQLPVRAAKAVRPHRHGIAYVIVDAQGAVLVERRPRRGLLGGMLGLPGTPWTPDRPAADPPLPGPWRAAGSVRHVFTHFSLDLAIEVIECAASMGPAHMPDAVWLAPDQFRTLPTLYRKALALPLLSVS